MPTSITRARKRRHSRRSNPAANRPQPVTPIGIVSFTATGSNLSITLDQPVILNGIPGILTDQIGRVPTAAALTTPSVVMITYSGTVTSAAVLTIPFQDPAIRNASGGFVNGGVFKP